jgi:cation transport ATPase
MNLTRLLESPSLCRWEYPATLTAIILMTLAFMLGIEKLAERNSGYRVQWWARLFIPLPVLLVLGANFVLAGTRYWEDTASADRLLFAALLTAIVLPWLVSSGEGRKTPLRLVFAVWAICALFTVLLFYLLIWAYASLRLGL